MTLHGSIKLSSWQVVRELQVARRPSLLARKLYAGWRHNRSALAHLIERCILPGPPPPPPCVDDLGGPGNNKREAAAKAALFRTD